VARLIDDLRAHHAFQMPVWVAPHRVRDWDQYTANLLPHLENRELPVLLIDNVADYYFHVSDQEFWSLDKDFPNLAPPFPAFWCEHRLPNRIHSKEKGDTDLSTLIDPNAKVGILVHAADRKDVTGEFPEATRWVLWCELFIDYGHRGKSPSGPHGAIFFCVDAEGRCLDKPWMQGFADQKDDAIMKALIIWVHPTLLAISFLHCKNVTITENTVPKPLAKKYFAKTGSWPVNYKTLVIEPLKQILRREGKSDTVGVAKAMHICRGHFRDYREGRGLFGKYKQVVWTPMTVRGTKGKSAPPREIEVRI